MGESLAGNVVDKTHLHNIYDNIREKQANDTKLYYINTDNFSICIKINDFLKDIENDVEKQLYASNYEAKIQTSSNQYKHSCDDER